MVEGIAELSLKYKLYEHKISSILVEQNTITSGAAGLNEGFYSSGILDTNAFQFNPLNIMLAMAEKINKSNKSIFEYSNEQKITKKMSEFNVTISNGEIINF